jgi:hypothetical protein
MKGLALAPLWLGGTIVAAVCHGHGGRDVLVQCVCVDAGVVRSGAHVHDHGCLNSGLTAMQTGLDLGREKDRGLGAHRRLSEQNAEAWRSLTPRLPWHGDDVVHVHSPFSSGLWLVMKAFKGSLS